MPEYRGRLRGAGRVALLVSQYNERVTTRLLDGARACCRAAAVDESAIDVVWVPGAFELGGAAAALAASGRFAAIVALGCVVRGDTPHFQFVAGEAARSLAEVAVRYRMPVGFGVLTTDSMDQALARAGGDAGNKGYEAAEAALRLADLLGQIAEGHAPT